MRTNPVRRIVMVFVDGLGLGGPDPEVNPLQPEVCPRVTALLKAARPIDACLGIPGLPQSATGQTTLLTGVNAARAMGRHIEGFPGKALIEIIETHNIFKLLAAHGLRSTFANGYLVHDAIEAGASRIKSVTTVSTLSGLGTVRNRYDLERNEAVGHDLTREQLRDRGYGGPLIDPVHAAEHLLRIARTHHFTLFEYFQTDRAGHKADLALAQRVLRVLDAFLGRMLDAMAGQDELSLVLTSDHGNIENCRVGTHTRNPVPFATVGPAETLRAHVNDLTEVTPAIVEWLAGGTTAP